MRRTTGFAAVLLAAGVVGGNAPGQSLSGGQNLDLAPADPIIPLPLGHDRMESVGGLYTAAEFVIYRQTNPINRQLIAVRGFFDVDGAVTADLNGTVVNTDSQPPFTIRGPFAPGTFYGSGTPALFTDDLRGQETFQPGWAFSIGYKFDSGSKIEFKWLHIARSTWYANASLIPPGYAVGQFTEDSFLFSPVVNYPVEFTGAANEIALGNPNSLAGIWNGAINMAIDFRQGYDQYDIAGSVPWYQNDVCRVYGKAGGRFAWIWERFRWRTVSADFLGNSIPEDVAIYTNAVSNRMYGPFVGMGVDRYLGAGFAVAVEGEVAGLVDIVRQRAKYVRGDKGIQSKRSINSVAFVPEVAANVNLYWYPFEGVQIRAGYNFLAFFNTVAAEEPISFDFRALDPNWSNIGTRFIDGLNVGVAFIF
jgi:hypothetical protein